MTRESSARYSLIWASQLRCPSCTPPARYLDAATPSPTYVPDVPGPTGPRYSAPGVPRRRLLLSFARTPAPATGLPRSAGAGDRGDVLTGGHSLAARASAATPQHERRALSVHVEATEEAHAEQPPPARCRCRRPSRRRRAPSCRRRVPSRATSAIRSRRRRGRSSSGLAATIVEADALRIRPRERRQRRTRVDDEAHGPSVH